MVQKSYYECDRCGAKCEKETIYCCTDRVMDGAGSMEDVWEKVDLCNSCAHDLLLSVMSRLNDHAVATDFFKEAISKKKGK